MWTIWLKEEKVIGRKTTGIASLREGRILDHGAMRAEVQNIY